MVIFYFWSLWFLIQKTKPNVMDKVMILNNNICNIIKKIVFNLNYDFLYLKHSTENTKIKHQQLWKIQMFIQIITESFKLTGINVLFNCKNSSSSSSSSSSYSYYYYYYYYYYCCCCYCCYYYFCCFRHYFYYYYLLLSSSLSLLLILLSSLTSS